MVPAVEDPRRMESADLERGPSASTGTRSDGTDATMTTAQLPRALRPRDRQNTQDTFFGEVNRRIANVQNAVSPAVGLSLPAHKSGGPYVKASNSRSSRSAAAAATAVRMDEEGPVKEAPQPLCLFGFRLAVTSVIVAVALISCCGMIVEVYTSKHNVLYIQDKWNDSEISVNSLITRLVVDKITKQSYSFHLTALETVVKLGMKEPSDEAVDAVWNTLRAWQKFGRPLTGDSGALQRHELMFVQWASLESQWTERPEANATWLKRLEQLQQLPHVDSVSVFLANDQYIAAEYNFGNRSPSDPFRLPKAFYWDKQAGNESLLFQYSVKPDGSLGPETDKVKHYTPTQRPPYITQAAMWNRSQALARPTENKRAWSEIFRFFNDKQTGLSWTAPVAYCGDYSCFEGVVSAEVTLDHVNAELIRRWSALRDELGEEYSMAISDKNSSIFILNLEDRHGQQGLLVAASNDSAFQPGCGLTYAHESRLEVVRSTAQLILRNASQIANTSAGEDFDRVRDFTYSISDFLESGKHVPCQPTELMKVDDSSENCRRVAHLTVELDEVTRWLAVLVLPVGAFTAEAVKEYGTAKADVQGALGQVIEISDMWVNKQIGLCVGVLVLSLASGIFLGHLVSWPLRRLSKLMRRLGELDFAHDSPEWREFRSGRRSRIRDIGRLQHSFWSLSRGVEAFAHFVPEAVVRNIMRGDPRSTRLHVVRKRVTVMFSDIRDFTSISEKLSQKDLLFLLTRYLSVMTHIVEMFEGVVAEVLGDGLLCFWNTPEDVEQHGALACMAALAMQQALVFLNEEFSSQKLCQLAVRIGIHTGEVLSGNIGSTAKMKFGCLGDPVNTAARLEGLCKYYGVGVLCSASTHSSLPSSANFFCRKLDLVQVKGKRQPLTIFEVIGRDFEGSAVPVESSLSIGAHDAASSATAAEVVNTPSALSAVAASRGRRSCGGLWSRIQRTRRTLTMLSSSSTVGQAPSGSSESSPGWAGDRRGSTSSSTTGGEPAWSPTALAFEEDYARDSVTDAQRGCVELYEAALVAFQQARFTIACELLLKLLEKLPHDLAARKLHERAARHAGADGGVVGLSDEELRAWTGVLVLDEK